MTMMWRGPGNGATRQFWPFGRPEVALGQHGATKVFLAIFFGSRMDKVRSTTINVSIGFSMNIQTQEAAFLVTKEESKRRIFSMAAVGVKLGN